MRAAGLVVAGALARTAELVAPGVTTGQLDAAAAEFIADGGSALELQGLPRLPRGDLHLGQRRGRPRHPGRPGAARG